jgi:hypothetical protein
MLAWRLYADDNLDRLVAAQDLVSNPLGRPNWFSGWMNFSGDRVNWDENADMVKSPLWKYVGQTRQIFKCPADKAMVKYQGKWLPRVRSNSMGQHFGNGEWLNKTFDANQKVWRTYARLGDIVNPAKSWVLIDEHPDSINDAAFANACTGAEARNTAQIIDMPGNYHNGACGFSFSDGHSEIHRWIGSKLRNMPVYFGRKSISLNVPAEDSWIDVNWMAQNTTVKVKD